MSSKSDIVRFYERRSVLITGATGFLGAVLLEKLLRSTNVAKIYLLIRTLKGKSGEERVKELVQSELFEKVRNSDPSFCDRLVTVAGDISEPRLGLLDESRRELMENVEIVFHAAATVRLDENLTKAYRINATGTEQLLDLCKHMKRLKSFIYVSTAYSNCHLSEIDEIFYPPPENNVLDTLEKMADEELSQLSNKILGAWPNTYSYTKALAEDLVRCHGNELPIAVFRPSIVTSTYHEPISGWIDNLYGPTGVFAAAILGLLHVVRCDGNCQADLIPVDMCVSALICSAWDVARQHDAVARQQQDTNYAVTRQQQDRDYAVARQPLVYNYVSSAQNPITWSEATALMRLHSNRYPSSKAVWTVKLAPVSSLLGFVTRDIVYHALPAYLCDACLLLTGQKRQFVAKYHKIRKFTGAISNFSTKQWIFHNDNVVRLWRDMGDVDRKTFNFNMAAVNWLDYFRVYVKGIRKFLVGEEEDSLKAAMERRRKLDWIHQAVKMTATYLTVCLGVNLFKSILNLVKTYFLLRLNDL